MSDAGDRVCLERMCDVVGAGEEDLVKRVTEAAATRRISNTPRTTDAWRDSIRGLSDLVFQAAYGLGEDGYAEGPAHKDPVVAYGVVRARVHRRRGVDPDDWGSLFQEYRRAYRDLLEGADMDEDELFVCQRFVERVFDRFEEGFRQGYAQPFPADDLPDAATA